MAINQPGHRDCKEEIKGKKSFPPRKYCERKCKNGKIKVWLRKVESMPSTIHFPLKVVAEMGELQLENLENMPSVFI